MKRIFGVGVMCLFFCFVILQCVVFAAGKLGAAQNTLCLITSTGALKCVGSNQSGQLGIGKKKAPQENNGVYYSDTPVSPIGLSSGVKAVAGYDETFCAVTATGGVKCWGANSSGNLGIGTDKGPEECPPYPGAGDTAGPCSTKPLDVKGVTGAVNISVGGSFACALLKTGTVKCWGHNMNGQLGNSKGAVTYGGYTMGNSSSVAVDVEGLTGATAITSGASSSCALLSNGTVKCWGFNSDGELGTGKPLVKEGEPDQSFKPVTVVGISGAVQISSTAGNNCALLSSGKVKCWGWVTTSVPGVTCDQMSSVSSNNGEEEEYCNKTSKPLEIPDLEGVKKLSGNCALLKDGSVKCWGARAARTIVIEQLNGETITDFYSDYIIGCAVVAGGKVKCFGGGSHFLPYDEEAYNRFDVYEINGLP